LPHGSLALVSSWLRNGRHDVSKIDESCELKNPDGLKSFPLISGRIVESQIVS
jgi:hypothetical protein